MPPSQIQTNSPSAWLLAARPKTLTGAAVPVMIGLSLSAWDLNTGHVSGTFRTLPAILCMLFAFLMQIDANLVNDYVDFRKGADDETRLGPKRACAQGWITLPAMLRGIVVTTLLSCGVGFPLICYGGWPMLVVGAACVMGCFLYTTHLSYMGLGDILVILFFGLVPVCTTYYLQTGTMTRETLYSSLACGLVVDTLLVVNNYRDRDGDRRNGKYTLVVRMGTRFSEYFYLALGLIACCTGIVFFFQERWGVSFLPLAYLFLHAQTWRKMRRIHHGRALNNILGENARNIFLYGIFFATGVFIDLLFLHR